MAGILPSQIYNDAHLLSVEEWEKHQRRVKALEENTMMNSSLLLQVSRPLSSPRPEGPHWISTDTVATLVERAKAEAHEDGFRKGFAKARRSRTLVEAWKLVTFGAVFIATAVAHYLTHFGGAL